MKIMVTRFILPVLWLLSCILPFSLQALPLQQRSLERSGNGRMVTIKTYLGKAVEQVDGKFHISFGEHEEYQRVKVPLLFYEGQTVGEVIRNFCLMHNVFSFHFTDETVNIFPRKSTVEGSKLWDNTYTRYSGYDKGSLFAMLTVSYSFLQPFSLAGASSDAFYAGSDLQLGGNVEFMLTDNLFFSFSGGGNNFKTTVSTTTDGEMTSSVNISHFLPALNYQWNRGRFSLSAGLGIGFLVVDFDSSYSETAMTDMPEHFYSGSPSDPEMLTTGIKPFIQLGARFRLLASLHLNTIFMAASDNLFSLFLGVSTKMLP